MLTSAVLKAPDQEKVASDQMRHGTVFF